MSNNQLPTDYQAFIHKSRYAKYREGEGRESWSDTVTRFMDNIVKDLVDSKTKTQIEQAIVGTEVMPSMRSLMTAGPAADRDNTCMYNCSYLPVDDVKAFDEAMFILLCGTGVGFSVERQFVNQLPDIPTLFVSETNIMVKDSKEGWAKALRQLIALLYSGEIPTWDITKVRPAGAPLKTFGGRASGPKPLVELFDFTIRTFKNAAGRKLSSIECHDIMCKIGEVVVVGGVRRSAMISLSNLSDDRMRHAKSGAWWENDPQRALANNSVSYTEKPDAMSFMREWTALVESGSGERGIFNREASKKQAAKNGRRDSNFEFGTNPCSEIILRPNQFCNLTEVVVRATDDLDSLTEKVRLATILGTIQSSFTKFPYLRKIWQKNTEEERLLGVSLTGIMDNKLMTLKNKGLAQTLDHLKTGAVVTADMSAIEQLEMWLAYQRHWCEHKPSVTINVKSDEWFEVGAFVYKHFDEMSGVSFLPFNEHTYQQAPYQECGKSDYKMLKSLMPKSIDWSKLSEYESEDNTAGSQTLACSGDSCELVDLV